MPAVATPGRTRQQIRPFEIGTDIRWEGLGSQAMTLGSSNPVTFQLNKTGLLAWLKLRMTGTFTSVAGSAYAPLGPWNALKRIRLVTNMNNIVPIDVSGYSLYLVNCMMQNGWAPDVSADADLFTAGFNTGGVGWVLMLDVPVSLNLGPQRRFGVINVQDPTVQVQLQITPGAIGDAMTGAGTSAASVNVELLQGNWEIPDQRVYEVPVGPGRQTIHYLLEKPYPLTSAGPQVLTLDRDDARLLRLYFYALVNGTRPTANPWTSFALRYNVVNTPISENEYFLKAAMRKETGLDWTGSQGTSNPQRAGAYVLDRWNSSHLVGSGSFWDTLYIPNISQIDFLPTLATGTTLASGDQMYLLRQELQRL